MAPQIIMLVLVFAGLLMQAYLHDKPKTGKHNFWITVVAWILQLALMYWGGFFNPLIAKT